MMGPWQFRETPWGERVRGVGAGGLLNVLCDELAATDKPTPGFGRQERQRPGRHRQADPGDVSKAQGWNNVSE